MCVVMNEITVVQEYILERKLTGSSPQNFFLKVTRHSFDASQP